MSETWRKILAPFVGLLVFVLSPLLLILGVLAGMVGMLAEVGQWVLDGCPYLGDD